MSHEKNPSSWPQTDEQQTNSAWSRIIASLEEVPDAFKPMFKMVVGVMGTNFPYTVFAPNITGAWNKTTEHLLCELGDTLYVWERTRQGVGVYAMFFDKISDFEFGSILLYSWMTFNGVNQEGATSTVTIAMNTTSVPLYARFVNRIRPAPNKMELTKRQAERAKFQYLANKNFKFMNYGLESLVEGAKVRQIVWQPQINLPVMKLGWHTFYRTRALAHLIVLTDQELIVIQDDERSSEN